MPEKIKSNELYITRMYDAPVKSVWEAWTDLKQVSEWWGPRGFTLTNHSKDLRPGGHWAYTMHGPDGTDYPNKTKYLEVEEYSRLVYDHGGNDDRPPVFRVTVDFEEMGGKTRMEMVMALPSAEAAVETKKFIKKAGGDSTWDRLAEYLALKSTGKDIFVINRSFDAPLEVMFQMWTDPDQLSRWVPPTGFTMKYGRADIRLGGSSFYCMTNGAGLTMYGRAKYLEISSPGRIVYTQEFSDENEKLARHPMAPDWPATMQTTVALESEGPKRTRVNLTWEIYGTATDAERDIFHKAKAGMAMGWTGSFDKLEALFS